MENQVVQVGIAVFLINEKGQTLLGKRKGTLNPGVYALPGGKPNFGEDLEETARREVLEETGITITGQLQQVGWKNNYFPLFGKHFTTLFYVAFDF